MKGTILAGGFGTRLRPLTHVINKHLLPVYNKPIILHCIELLKKSGISDILVISEESDLSHFSRFLKDGQEYGVTLSYKGQHGAGGIAEGLSLAKDFVGTEPVALLLGDNIFENDFSNDIKTFKKGAKVFLKEVPDPERFGIPVINGDKISIVEEKPAKPQSRYAIAGFYLFDNGVFDVIAKLQPSKRGELEITDAVNAYARNGTLGHRLIDGFWSDVGTFESLLAASIWVAGRESKKK